MKPETAHHLRSEYDYFWRDNLSDLPDGWVAPLVRLWTDLDGLNRIDATRDRHIIYVALRYEIYASSAAAYAMPVAPGHLWTPAWAMALVRALEEFHSATQGTCQVCGSADAWLWNTGDHDRVLCDEHGRELQQEIARAGGHHDA